MHSWHANTYKNQKKSNQPMRLDHGRHDDISIVMPILRS